MQNTCLIIHGILGNDQENWFPWLKQILEKFSWTVLIPNLPGSGHPKVREWNLQLQTLISGIEGNLIIIGHSIGAIAALNLVQTAGKEVSKVILVAPVNPQLNWSELEVSAPGLDWQAVRTFAQTPIDNQVINSLANDLVFYYSDNDYYIPESTINYYKNLFPLARFLLIKSKGHFSRPSGVTEFPEILQEFPLTNI